MAIRLNKRHKLSAGLVIMLVFIAAIELLLFSGTRKQYNGAKAEYDNLKSRISSSRSPQQELPVYSEETKLFEKEYEEVMGKVSFVQDPLWRKNNPKSTKSKIERLHQEIKNLIAFRDKYETERNPKIRLSFLGNNGWAFPRRNSIPPDFIANNSSLLVDRLDEIDDTFNVLEVIDSEVVEREKLRQLYRSMGELGISARTLYNFHDGPTDEGKPSVGKFVPTFKFLSHAFLLDQTANRYKKENPNYEFDEEKFIERTFKHFAGVTLEYPNQGEFFYIHRQIETIIKILKMMDKDYEIAQPDDKEIKEFLIEDVTRISLPDGALITTSTVKNEGDPPDVTNIGVILPFDITFTAENSKAWEFLWRVNNSQNLLDIENIEFKALKENRVQVRVLITDLAFVFGLSDAKPAKKVAGAGPPVPGGSPPNR